MNDELISFSLDITRSHSDSLDRPPTSISFSFDVTMLESQSLNIDDDRSFTLQLLA